MPWRAEELRALWSQTQSHLKAWSRSKSVQSELLYRRSKTNLQRALRAAKCNTLKALDLFSGKRKSISLPHALLVNGTLTYNPATIVDARACNFFSSEPLSDESHHTIDELAKSATDSSNSKHLIPAISDWEFETATASLLCSRSGRHLCRPTASQPALHRIC